jgi:carbamoyltransferase
MKILGLSAFVHDSAAALVIDDQIIAAVEEERFNRQKHTGKFPSQAIQYCLETAGIEAEELDAVAFYLGISSQALPALKELIVLSRYYAVSNSFFFRTLLQHFRSQPKQILHNLSGGMGLSKTFRWGSIVRARLGLRNRAKPALIGVPHHQAHIGSSYMISGFEEAGILIIDQHGERDATTLAVGRGKHIEVLKTIQIPHSLGSLYGAITAYLGFRALSDEGKVMGLSPYGKPRYLDEFRRYLEITPEGLYRLDTRYIDFTNAAFNRLFPKNLIDELGTARHPSDQLEQRHQDIASSLQTQLEIALIGLCQYIERTTRIEQLCIAGGIGLNSAANGRIAKELPQLKNIYVPPSPGDAGAALGAAVWPAARSAEFPHVKPTSPYLGPEYSAQACRQALEKAGLPYRMVDDACMEAAVLLSQGKVVGWYQGRMEFGPRALGNRSILAHPGSTDIRDRVNRLKGREAWRPLAPSILAEKAEQYFYAPCTSPYMSFVASARPEKADRIAGCIHVDGSARLQTVEFDANPKYWTLIKNFEQLTGIPCVLNTSFNGAHEPIVCTPGEAVAAFAQMGLDCLVLGDYVVDVDRMGTPKGI